MFVFVPRTLILVKCSTKVNSNKLWIKNSLMKESFQQIPNYLQIYATAITNTPPSAGPKFGTVELCPVLPEVLFPALLLPPLSPLVLVLVVEVWELDWGAQGFGRGSLFSVRDGWLSPPVDALLTKEANGLPPNYSRRKTNMYHLLKPTIFTSAINRKLPFKNYT